MLLVLVVDTTNMLAGRQLLEKDGLDSVILKPGQLRNAVIILEYGY